MRAGEACSSIEPAGRVAMDAAPAMRRNVLEQRVAHERRGGIGSRRSAGSTISAAERVVEMVERVVFGQAGERDELVGVERRADDGHALQHLARRRRDAADHVGVEGLNPARFVGGPASELVDRERDAATERGDLLDAARSRLGDVAADERGDIVVVERTELELGRAVAADQALRGSPRARRSSEPGGGRARCTRAGRASSGRCSAAGAGWRRRRRGRRRW